MSAPGPDVIADADKWLAWVDKQMPGRCDQEAVRLIRLLAAKPTEAPPTHPERLIWALWTNNDTGRLVLTNREGEVFHFDAAEAHAIAAALSDHCTDNDDRWFVRSEWADIDDEDEDDD